MVDIKKELLKIVGTGHLFDYTENIINLLIEKDNSNREIIERELIKIVDKKEIEHAEAIRKANSEAYYNNVSSINGQLYTKDDDMWFR